MGAAIWGERACTLDAGSAVTSPFGELCAQERKFVLERGLSLQRLDLSVPQESSSAHCSIEENKARQRPAEN